MKSCARISKIIFMLTMTVYGNIYTNSEDYLDVMSDFAYPVSFMQNVRSDVAQALYAVQQGSYDTAVAYLQSTHDNLQNCFMERRDYGANQDDKEFLQYMLDKINAMISQLEQQDSVDAQRALIEDLCQHIQNYV